MGLSELLLYSNENGISLDSSPLDAFTRQNATGRPLNLYLARRPQHHAALGHTPLSLSAVEFSRDASCASRIGLARRGWSRCKYTGHCSQQTLYRTLPQR